METHTRPATPPDDHPKSNVRLHALWMLVATLIASFLMIGRADAAGLLIADGGLGGRLEIVNHDVEVVINNGIVVTTVDQTFRNTENRVVEALYTFPVPRGASVSNFSMWINGKEMTGEVLEKERAREIYNSYKQTRKDPGLLEQTDFRTFEMRIWPIAANAEQRVRVTYAQELDFDASEAVYVYPLATSTQPDADTKVQGRFSLRLQAKSEIPIVDLQSPSHPDDFAVVDLGPNAREASLELTGGVDGADLGRDVVLRFDVKRPRTGIDFVANKADDDDGYLLLTVTAGEELAPTNEAMDYVFVLDVSGSMRDQRKLELSRLALARFIGALSRNDRFEVITFNNAPNTLFSDLRPADADAVAEAEAFIASQGARGGTELGSAFQTAYRYSEASGADRRLNVVVLSDGLTDQGSTSQLVSLINQRPAATRVFCVGVGNDANRQLLEQISSDAGGIAAFVSPQDDLDRQAEAFRRKLVRPAATDVRLSFDGAVYDVLPGELPDLYYGQPLRLYGRYKQGGPTNVTLTANVDGRTVEQVIRLDLPEAGDRNPQIERMWAWKQIDELLKAADARGSRPPAVVDEIVRLGEAYSIVTEYTSFIVLENDAEYRRWKIERRNASRVGRDDRAARRVREQLQQLRDEAMQTLGPAAPADTFTSAEAPTGTPINPRDWQMPRTLNNRDVDLASPQREPVATPQPQMPSFGGGGGGGGAIDPAGAAIAILLLGAAGAFFPRRSAR